MLYGLGAIKGTGEAALSVILKVRAESGPFRDLFDFCRRIDKRVVNRRVVEALIRAGAFDAVDDHRAKLLASTGVALEAAEQAERNAMQGGLFDMGAGAQEDTSHYVEVPRWSEREQLMNEKPALGFFFSGHPYHAYAAELASFVKRRLGQLEPQREPVLLAGVVMSTRTQMTRRGKMAVVVLDDGTTQIEVTVFNELWEAERAKIREDELLLVEGKVQDDAYSGGLRITADKLYTLAEARGRYARSLRLTMNGGSDAKRLQALLTPFRNGPCPVRLTYRNGDAVAELPLPENWRVRLDDDLIKGLADWLTPENVKVVYSMITLIDRALLDEVCAEAAASPRRRKNRNFHPRDDHPAHRLLNAMQPDSYIPPHRHLDPDKDETFVVLRGLLGLVLFDDEGRHGALRER
jgi:DNA polymerase-3 subunit alpha